MIAKRELLGIQTLIVQGTSYIVIFNCPMHAWMRLGSWVHVCMDLRSHKFPWKAIIEGCSLCKSKQSDTQVRFFQKHSLLDVSSHGPMVISSSSFDAGIAVV